MKPVLFDLALDTTSTGPIFGGESEDLDFTLLQWAADGGVAEHLNTEVDVLMVVVGGSGILTVDGVETELSAGRAVLIPKGTRRKIRAASSGFRYLNVHKRRKRLMPGDLANRPKA